MRHGFFRIAIMPVAVRLPYHNILPLYFKRNPDRIRIFRFKVPVVEYEKMKDEVVTLKREIMKANYEKDKILAMKISELDRKFL